MNRGLGSEEEPGRSDSRRPTSRVFTRLHGERRAGERPDTGHAFYRRLAKAERCPVAGPCPDCTSPELHFCVLAERQRAGATPADALADELAALGVLASRDAAAAEALRVDLMNRLCRTHRQEAAALLRRADDASANP